MHLLSDGFSLVGDCFDLCHESIAQKNKHNHIKIN